MRKNILKKLTAFGAVAGACACLLMPGAAFGNNYTDTRWEFYAVSGGSGYITSARAKTDDTSVYIKCTNASGLGISSMSDVSFYAMPHGSRILNGTYTNMSYVVNGISRSAAYHRVYNGKAVYMPSYIYEAGGRYAKIYYKTVDPRITFTGVWSPDSI